MFYNLICVVRGFSMPLHLVPFAKALVDQRIEKLLILIGPGSGKALHPDTPVLASDGWRPIKDIKVGDRVWSPDGACLSTVRAKRWQLPEPLWRVRFADGREVLVHSEHEWLTHHKKITRGEERPDNLLWRVETTREIGRRLASVKDLMQYVPLTEPLEFPHVDTPIPPYTLGVMIGDGNMSGAGYARVCNPDYEIIDELKKESEPYGYIITQVAGNDSECPNWSVRGMGHALADAGLAHKRSWEKFVPDIYKRGSVDQRWSILQGLMDTDGHVGDGGGANYSTTSMQLAVDVQELVWSLGGIAKLAERQTYFTSKGVRKSGRKSWRVSIRMRDPDKLFRLSRKRDRQKRGQYSDTLKLRIVSVEREREPQASVCISLDSADGLFLADNYVVTHNSTLLSEVYPPFALGHDPTLTILGVSAGEALMQGFMRSVMETIEWSPVYAKLFPRVRPDKAGGWSSERGMFVTGREIGNPDASFAAAGLDSKSLTGKHARLLICDDLHDKENAGSVDQCLKVWDTWHNTIVGRADPRGARYIVAGRRWNTSDVYAQLAATGEWVIMELPAERIGTNNLWVDVSVPDGLVCCFTEQGDDSVQHVRRRLRLPE
jgi:hypothetical protein